MKKMLRLFLLGGFFLGASLTMVFSQNAQKTYPSKLDPQMKAQFLQKKAELKKAGQLPEAKPVSAGTLNLEQKTTQAQPLNAAATRKSGLPAFMESK
jgi:hypothetical protein